MISSFSKMLLTTSGIYINPEDMYYVRNSENLSLYSIFYRINNGCVDITKYRYFNSISHSGSEYYGTFVEEIIKLEKDDLYPVVESYMDTLKKYGVYENKNNIIAFINYEIEYENNYGFPYDILKIDKDSKMIKLNRFYYYINKNYSSINNIYNQDF